MIVDCWADVYIWAVNGVLFSIAVLLHWAERRAPGEPKPPKPPRPSPLPPARVVERKS